MKTLLTAGLMAAAVVVTGNVHAQDAAALAQTKNCMACHAIDKKLMGPSFQEIAGKYAGDANAEQQLIAKIKAGGGGVWGPIPMPPNNITDEEGKTLVQWILSQK